MNGIRGLFVRLFLWRGNNGAEEGTAGVLKPTGQHLTELNRPN